MEKIRVLMICIIAVLLIGSSWITKSAKADDDAILNDENQELKDEGYDNADEEYYNSEDDTVNDADLYYTAANSLTNKP